MKTSHLFLAFFTLALVSCGQQQKETNDFSDFDFNSENTYNKNQDENSNGNMANKKDQNKLGQLKAYKIMNKQFGMVFGIMPIPTSWEVATKNKENILFEDPNGVKVYGEQFISNYFSTNQEQNYYAQQSGSIIKPPKSIEKVISEDLKPYLESKGAQFIGQFPLPQLAQADKRMDSYMFKSTPEQRNYQCIVTEWEDKEGNKSMGVIRYFTAQYPNIGGMDWGYTLNAMVAKKEVYEQAKKDYINALINFQINPQWVQANNQYYSQLSQQSNVGHQQRMAAIQAQGQAIINNGNTYSSIIDSNHESWKKRNAMSDAGQARTVDGIWERSNMSDSYGNQYKVEGYYNNVWKGANEQYIGADHTNWNPNIDNATNGTNWEQLEYTDDGYQY